MSFAAVVYEGGPFPGHIERLPQPATGSHGFAVGCEISYRSSFGGSYIVEAPIDPGDDKGRAVWHGPSIQSEDDEMEVGC